VTTPTSAQSSAIAFFKAQLARWGISELAGDAQRLIMQGVGEDSIQLELENTPAYKKRFAANELRRKAGLVELSPAEYVATETAYASVLRSYGLPKGFYDSRDDYTKWLAADVSPQELTQRASDAQQKYLNAAPENRTWWRQHYGGTDAEAIAGILDPAKAIPLMQQRLAAAAIGGAAGAQHLGLDTARAEYLAATGVTEAAARAGYADIAYALPDEAAIAQRFGATVGQADLWATKFGTADAAEAQRKLRQLNQSESGLFAGKPGADASSLSQSTAGSY
jgi:hypothetical protein